MPSAMIAAGQCVRHGNLGMAIGIFDSGLGGLTVYDAIRKQMTDLDTVYLVDHKHAPYKVRDVEDIYRCTTQTVRILFDKGRELGI